MVTVKRGAPLKAVPSYWLAASVLVAIWLLGQEFLHHAGYSHALFMCLMFAGSGMILDNIKTSRFRFLQNILGAATVVTASAGIAYGLKQNPSALHLTGSAWPFAAFALLGMLVYLKGISKKNVLVIQILWLLLFIVAFSGFIANVFNAFLHVLLFDHILRRYGTSFEFSSGLLILCLLQFYALLHLEEMRTYYSKRRDRQIVAQQIVMILALGVVASIGGAEFFAKDSMRVIHASLVDSLESNSRNFIDTVLIAANNSEKIGLLASFVERPNALTQDTLARLLELHRRDGVVSIRIRGSNGLSLASVGDLAGKYELRARLSGRSNAWLVWHEGLYLISSTPFYRKGKRVGDIEVRTSLGQMDEEFDHKPSFEASGEVVLCAKEGNTVNCFPSRLHQETGSYKHDFIHALPMAYALTGQSGVTIGQDYRGKVVLAAYKPISDLGFGMVQKVDVDELFAPARMQMFYAFVFLMAASGLVAWLLYRRTHPLVHDLTLAEAYSRTILNNIPEAVVTTDDKGVVRSFNLSARKILGEGFVERESIFPLYSGAAKDMAGGLIEESMRIEGSTRKEDGSLFPYELTIGTLSFKDERFFIYVVRDLTERRQAELRLQESERYTRNLIENLRAGVVVHDRDGSVKYMNRAAARFFGFEEGLKGQHIPDLFMRFLGEDGNAIPLEALPERRVLADEQPFNDCVFGVELSGWDQPRWGLVSAFPDFDENGMVREVIVSFVDITERRIADEALRKTKEKMLHIVETSPAATYIVTLDETGTSQSVSFMGSRICSMVGYSLDHWKNPLFWPAHIHPEDRGRVMANQKVLFEKGELRHEYRFRHENGNWIWVYDQLILVRNEKGIPVELVGAWLDVSLYKQTQFGLANMNRLYQVLSQVNGATVKTRSREELFRDIVRIVVDSGGFSMAWIGLFNEEIDDIVPIVCHGHDAEGYLGRFKSTGIMSLAGPAALIILEGRHQLCQDIEADPKAVNWKEEALMRGYRSSGSFPFRLGGEVIGIINLYADVVDYFDEDIVSLLEKLCDAISFSIDYLDEQEKRMQAEEQLRQINADLELRIEKRTKALEAANAELEAFSYSVSHDLRAPLRHLDGFGEILARRYADQFDDEAKSYLDRMRKASSRMMELIEDLLELSRITLREIRKTEVDLSSIASEVIAGFVSGNRNITWAVEPGITAQCDRRLMKIVMENLLGNALKFTSSRAEARIEFGMFDADGEKIMYVRDNGVGFNMQHASRLFGTFQRLHKAEEFEGTGIGLATVQRIIRKHGGSIWAEAEPGVGATFYFRI